MRAGLLVEGDQILNPRTGAWIEVVRTASADEGRAVRVQLLGTKPMTWKADFEVEVRRGDTGRAIDLAGLGQQEVIVSE